MRVFHIATAADWAAARGSGSYTTSTRGRTLEQEGFIHASRREQVAGVWRSFYSEAGEPLVLLTIDTDKLDAPWREDAVGNDTYPHVYGPVNASAVIRAQPMDARGGTGSFFSLLVGEMFLRIGLFAIAMLLAVLGSMVGAGVHDEWGGFAGGVLGLVAGLAVMQAVLRRP